MIGPEVLLSSKLPAFLVQFSDYRIQMSMHFAALTLLFYDWSLTLSDEIKYIWKAKWSGIKVAFLLNRYLFPLDIIFAAYFWSGSASWLTPSSCKIVAYVDNFTIVTSFVILHYVVAVRTWSIWGHDYTMGLVIWGGFAAYLFVILYLTAQLIAPLELAPTLFVHICIGQLPSFLWVSWLPSIAFETFIFVLTAIKARQHTREQVGNNLLSIFYRDGFMYFIFITVVSFINLFLWAFGRTTQVMIFRYFSAAICQAAGSHLILDLLATAALRSNSHEESSSSDPGRTLSAHHFTTVDYISSFEADEKSRVSFIKSSIPFDLSKQFETAYYELA